jgi:Protein of unknown function (DUF1549)/Protein of unknown function (DUF1553)/Protein of unknown function (DUF1800)
MAPPPPTRLIAKSWLACLTLLIGIGPAFAQAPLHERIDQLIRAGHKDYDRLASPVAGDAEFLRRVYLDVTGVIPTAEETQAFFGDTVPDKRAKLIDRLLASERYAYQMRDVFDVLWMDRRPDKHVKRAEWLEFLRDSFAANKPYDQLVREILSADGTDPKARAAARFFLDREGEPNLLTRDISRLFLGMNLQCAQCHDHPLVDAYKQDYFYGIYAFLNRSYVFTDKTTKVAIFAEKGDGDVSFQSVFKPKLSKSTGPRLPEGMEVKEPKFDKGQEYEKPVKQGERGIPKFSRRAQLAGLVIAPENKRFARSVANRLWWLYLGRGLVQPVEFDHDANPPSHPELLQLLADEFIANKHDLKAMIREILLSQTYQRSSELPKGAKDPDPAWFITAQLRPLSPEQLAWSTLQATGQLDVERKALGAKGTDAALRAKLAAPVTTFVTLFGNQPGEPAGQQDFEATLDQTLFLRNGTLLRDWMTPRPGNLLDRLNSLKEMDRIAEELYVSVLTRQPTADEQKEVADYLTRHAAERTTALQELAWALLTSAEFRFNH